MILCWQTARLLLRIDDIVSGSKKKRSDDQNTGPSQEQASEGPEA